jgi:hypothetical protein
LELVIESATTERERRDDCHIAEYIARNRMQRSQFSSFQHISRSDAKKTMKNPRLEGITLAPTGLVSELEMVNLYVLDVNLHLNPSQHAQLFDRAEDFSVQELVPQLGVEAFAVAVLPALQQ